MSRAQLNPLQMYGNLMEEVKARIGAADAAITGKYPVHPVIAQEIAYLQLRLLCETIALGCLVAHGHITNINFDRLHKEYDADKIIKEMAKLHADFYPVPIILTQLFGNMWGEKPRTEGFLTKQELLKLYGITGNFLHRGRLKKLLESMNPEVDFSAIAGWLTKIGGLMSVHQIHAPGRKVIWDCILTYGAFDGSGPVRVAVACQVEIPQKPQT
jgi:hypothetical protein